jgi:segregation and condensation protein B
MDTTAEPIVEPTVETTVEAKSQAEPATVLAPSAALAGPDPAGRPRRTRGSRASSAAAALDPRAGDDAAPPTDSAAPTIDPALIAGSVEAILLSSDRPIPPAKVADALGPTFAAQGIANPAAIKRAVEHLNEAYAREGRSFRIEAVSGGLRLMTRPEYAEVLARFHGQRGQTRLSRAAIESLAIIAYKQPITRAEIESIRGVASGEILRTLMERRLVTITGRAEELGRPMLYGTTRQFLEVFGLASLKDLPPPEEFGLQA